MRVVIAGGGVSGLIAAHVFKKRGADVVLLEPRAVGGEFLAGGLKYIHNSQGMCELFDEFDLPYSNYTVQGGILLRGGVHQYPKVFQTLDREEAAIIQADHYRKTRRTEGGDDARKAMNDPAAVKPRKALRCNFRDMVKDLASGVPITKAGLMRIKTKSNEVVLSTTKKIGYDVLILTVPLWVIKEAAPFYVPQGMAMQLNLADIVPVRDRYAKWDYVYTPYTPANMIHRFSPSGRTYSVEINGEMDRAGLESDLSFIFSEGYVIENIREGLKGHLLPLDQQPEWPSNVAPLGRFAKWDSRATTDVTLEDAKALADRWMK